MPALAVMAVMAVTASACDEKRSDRCPRYVQHRRVAPAGDDPAVAEVNGRPILASAVSRRVREARTGRKEALLQLIEEELLVQEAERRGIHQELDVVVEGKQAAIYAYLRQAFEQEFTRKDVPESHLRRVYRANARRKFQRPELRRFAHLYVARPWSRRGRRMVLDGAKDRALRRKMEILHQAVVRADPGSTEAFLALAKIPEAKAAGVAPQTAIAARGELRDAFADALWALSAPFSVSDVIATKPWYHIAFLVQIIPGTDISYAQARDEILDRVWPYARKQAFLERIQKLRGMCRIVMKPENLPVTPLREDSASAKAWKGSTPEKRSARKVVPGRRATPGDRAVPERRASPGHRTVPGRRAAPPPR